MLRSVLAGILFLGLGTTSAQSYRFDFGAGPAARGYTKVTADMKYTSERGYGFLPGSSVQGFYAVRYLRDYITSSQPFFFSVNLPEGNYDVKVLLGDEKDASYTTIKVENRRLMLEKVETKPRKLVWKEFTVNLKSARISDQDSVRLKPREKDYRHWDNQLTFEFTDALPKVAALEIRRNTKAQTIFLAGNSTVVDQPQEPYAAWGQMIPRFFKPAKVVIANYAESGESLRSFLAEKRLEKILSVIKPNDYLFIEFAHNDQKQKDLLPLVGYKELLKKYIAAARDKGAKPVLITSMHRRNFDAKGQIVNTLGDFPEAMRQTAKEENVPLIDLNAMSKTLWEALGPRESEKAFVHIAAGSLPGVTKDIHDNTHFSNYGAYLLAQCVVNGIKSAQLDLAKELVAELPGFDPAHPPLAEQWKFPASPLVETIQPDGN
ncbi:rhamnogalacturonan acetylesterase [Siphonobacter sp. SORGH_AS_1065]|uniref:rhamnogalacturonan acetylesterase n=1 Tax=Siphonobacter sp. SORGH_AS_1065 TaxID=3041795 RepID=UPI002784FCEE|nr:rhamnogalacturonan acetylesterase [Siphonobacter sp. SORGH_AS_1065]MDQ1088485.1 lysophospholipase L1-like esterase [Siphonobacter sp. SORGH_AS_1065]